MDNALPIKNCAKKKVILHIISGKIIQVLSNMAIRK